MLKISIITVSFNSAKFIEETIGSVIAQTYNNIEHIIIDGGSTDGTIDIINKYRSQIAYFVSEPDKNMYDAINKSIVDFGDVSEIKEDLIQEIGMNNNVNRRGKVVNYKNNLLFSLWGTGLIVGLVLFINLYYSPNRIWFVYPLFAILWWPLSLFFVWLNKGRG